MKNILASRLREIRGIRSQTEFARLIGLKQTSYSGWESGAKVPAATAVAQIANAMGVSADWILGLADAPKGHLSVRHDEVDPDLKSEVDRLKAENAGLKYALDAIGKGGVTASARRTALATGA